MTEYNKEPELSAKIDEMLQNADQEAKTESSESTNTSTGDNLTPVQEAPAAELSEIEKEARAIGWKSREERAAEGKDNKYFVDADEYVRRQPLFNIIEKQKKELNDLRKLSYQTQSNIASLRREGYEQAIREIEAKQEAAASEANIDEFRRLKLQANNLQQQMREDPIVNVAPPPLPTIDPNIAAFGERNRGWYNDFTPENKKMKAAAEAVDNFLVQQANIDGTTINVNNHLAMIETEVKRLFPHRFETPKTEAKTATSVAKSTVSTVSTNKTDFKSKLTDQQLSIYEYLKQKNPKYTVEEYANELDKLNVLKK